MTGRLYDRVFARCCTYVVAILLFPLLAAAQEYSLADVLLKVEQRNPSLLAYQNRIKAMDENAKGATAWMPPQAGVEVGMMPYNFNANFNSGLRFSAMQDIPNQKKNQAREDYMKSLAESEKHGGAFYKVALFAEAKEAFYRIYISERRIGVLKENTDALKLMIELATKQMAITRGDLASIYRLKARLAESESTITYEEGSIHALYAKLNFLMNEDVDRAISIDTSGLMKTYAELSSYLKVDAIGEFRSDILKMNSEINSMKLAQQYTALRSKSEFGVRLQHSFALGAMPNNFSIMGTMSIPSAPWSAKAYTSEERAMSFRIAAMEQDKSNMTNAARQLMKVYLIELGAESKEIDNYTQLIMPAYKKSLDANLLAYGQNTNDMSMTLLAWDDLLMSQMQYLRHLDNYFKIQTAYERELQVR